MNNSKLRIDWKNIIFLVLNACIMSLVCVGSSPILDYMDPDSQNFWLIGRSMVSGQIAYVDIFDHKGPYIFFINAIGALFNKNFEIGLFILECIAYSTAIIMVYKIAQYFVVSKKNAALSAMAYLGISFNFFTFVTGNLTETWTMPFQLITIYLIVKYYFDENNTIEHPPIYMFIHGLCACIVGFMRPNNAGMWIPFAIVLAWRLFKHKKTTNFFKNLGMLVLGVFTGSLPLLIYGFYYDCMEEMWYGTFLANVQYSSNNAGRYGVIQFLKNFVTEPAFIIIIFCIVSSILVIKYVKNKYVVVSYLSMFATTLVFMNLSLRCDGQYYHLSMIFIMPLLFAFFNKLGDKIKLYFWITIIICGTLISNLQLIKQITKYGYFHYFYESAVDMREIMEEVPGDKVLVTGCNSVFYNVTHTIPHIKYFITYGYGLDYNVFPDATNQQVESVCSGENDYLMITFCDEEKKIIYGQEDIDIKIIECLTNQYEIVYENDDINLVMYRKKTLQN